jgi:hypothetical protein
VVIEGDVIWQKEGMMPSKNSTSQQSQEIAQNEGISQALQSSIDRLSRSMAVLAIYNSPYKDRPDTERIPFLAALGFERDDIAAILCTTSGTVQKQLSLTRTGKLKKKTAIKKANKDALDKPKTS